KLNFDLFRNYIKIGLPVIIGDSIWGLAMAAQTAILGHMGSTAIAANSIASTIFQIVSVVAYGTASASSVIIARTIGEGNVGKVKSYAVTMQILFVIIGIITGAVLFISKDLIIDVYAVTPETKSLAINFMTVLSITVVGTSYQMACHTGIIRGGGDTKFIFIVDMIFMWGIVLPSATIAAFIFNMSPLVVFVCLKCDQILKCFVAVIKINRFKWIKEIGTVK
ncbi:MAG: MATE family efflux transporter, partial [Oscillospiraceae bacterium]